MNQEKYNEIYRAVCARVEALGYECAGFEAVSTSAPVLRPFRKTA